MFEQVLVAIRGGGDLATGVAYRLVRAGFPVILLELAHPLVIRRAVAFAEAVHAREVQVDGMTASLAEDSSSAAALARSGVVAVLVDPAGAALSELNPAVVVDARMIKRNPGDTTLDQAELVIALGPGYEAGQDCHAVIETNRGHDLGRVIWEGAAEPDTGVPGHVAGRAAERVLRAPATGRVEGYAQIGDQVTSGQVIAVVGGEALRAPFDGVLRGLICDGAEVTAGKKMGDVDPRGVRRFCFSISDKALAVGGGVVEAVLSSPQLRGLLG